MNSRHGWAGAGVLCLALVSIACDVKVGESGGLSVDFASGKATDEWVRTYDIKPGGRLDIINVNGQIQASPATGTQVEVHATREVRAGSEEASREMLRKAEMREEVSPDRVSIQGPEPQREGREFGRRGCGHQVRRSHSAWPERAAQDAERGSPDRERPAQPESRPRSTNGGITGRGISGALEAQTVNGGITMDLEAVTGETRMVTVNGGVMLTLAPGVNAELEATVVNGGVQVQEGVALSADERTRQRVAGRIGSGGPRLVVQTTNGGVRVVPRGAPGS